MTTKMQEQAIVIADDDMTPQETQSLLNLQPMPGSTYFDVQLAIEKESTLDDEKVLIQRLVKNFFYNKKIEPGNQYFSPRRECSYEEGEDLIDNQIIIHGCDFKKMKLVKKEFETNQAMVINPSNFKLIYKDKGSAWQALLKNAKEPSVLLSKAESDEDHIPKGWFEMKPYTFNNRLITVTARFATSKELNLEPAKQEWNEIYKQCAEIFNQQEKMKRQEQACLEAKVRERLDIRRQNNSDRLYSRYGKQTESWERGKNSNPGAHRQGSRSRSRSKEKSQRMNNEGDKESNYSFILGKDLNNVTEMLNSCHLKEKSVVGDLSIEMGSSKEGAQNQSYNWNGSVLNSQGVTISGWSYNKYMEEKEAEEERTQSHKKAVVITID